MDKKTLVFIKTHTLNNIITKEYEKIIGAGYKCVLYVDNRKKLLFDDGKEIQKDFIFGSEIEYILTYEKEYSDLHLPNIGVSGYVEDFTHVLWYNCDYPFYIVRNIYKDYDFYWQFENDCYFNAETYISFFKQYEDNTDDLLLLHLTQPSHKCIWLEKTEWIYNSETKYHGLFPIERLSGKAIDFLYERRLQHKLLFDLKSRSSDREKMRWIHCELFVPTELLNNNFTGSAITYSTCGISPQINDEFIKNKRYLKYDNIMYHPIKHF